MSCLTYFVHYAKKTILLFLTDNRSTNQIQMKNTCPFYTGHYSRKKKQRGGWEHTFLETPPGISRFFILPLESPDKTKFLETAQNCYNPWKFQDLNQEPLEIPHDFFLIIRENPNPWKFHLLFLQYIPLEIPYPPTPFPPVVFFLEQPTVLQVWRLYIQPPDLLLLLVFISSFISIANFKNFIQHDLKKRFLPWIFLF